MKQIKLEVGHTYLTRIGTRVKIVKQEYGETYPFVGNNLMRYTSAGGFNRCRVSSLDLVAEVVGFERKTEGEK